MQINLSAKQGEAWAILMDDKTGELGYGGAAGGGKSYLGVARLWTMANKYPGTRRFMGRKELTNLKKSTLNSYYKFLADYKIPKVNSGKLDGKDNIIKYLNGSEILLLDCAYQPSDPLYTRFGSLELTGGFIDESNEVGEQCITILNTRVGRQRNQEFGLKPKILETFNPDKGHVYRRFYKPWKEGVLKEYRQFIPAKVTDNKYIDPNYIEQLQKADEITRQRLLYGNFEYDDTFGKLFRYDEIIDLFRNNVGGAKEYIDPFTQMMVNRAVFYISCDVARLGNDKTVIGVRKGLELIKIVTILQQPTDIVADKIKELETEFEVNRNHIVIDSDGVGGGVADQLRGCVNFVNNATAFKTYSERASDYYQQNFANLKAQCYFKLKDLMEKRNIRVHADGQVKDDLSNELDNIVLKNTDKDQKITMETKEDMKRRIGRSPDYADCLMMRMIRLVREEDQHVEEKDLGVFETDWSGILS